MSLTTRKQQKKMHRKIIEEQESNKQKKTKVVFLKLIINFFCGFIQHSHIHYADPYVLSQLLFLSTQNLSGSSAIIAITEITPLSYYIYVYMYFGNHEIFSVAMNMRSKVCLCSLFVVKPST